MAPGLLTNLYKGDHVDYHVYGTSWSHVNVPSIDIGDLRAPCLLPSIRGTSELPVYFHGKVYLSVPDNVQSIDVGAPIDNHV